MPFAPSFAASAFSRLITASVLPCEVKEKECLLDVSRIAISSYLPAGSWRYSCTCSGEMGGRTLPTIMCEVTHPHTSKLTRTAPMGVDIIHLDPDTSNP